MSGSDSKPEDLLCLVKFGSKNRLTELFETGKLYLNSVEYFKGTENPDGRNDYLEGAVELIQLMPGSVISYEHPSGVKEDIPISKGVFHKYILGNLGCFYGVSEQHFVDGTWKVNIDERMKGLGDHILFIFDKNRFLKLIEQKVIENNLGVKHGFVQYDLDEDTHIGEVSLFQKRQKFSYQKEYRVFINTGSDQKYILELGNIKDLCKVMAYDTFKETTFTISKRTMKFHVSPTQTISEKRDFISTDKRLQLKGDFSRFQGLSMHLGTVNDFSKEIPLFDSQTFINEDITWCKNIWFEWKFSDAERMFEIELS